MNDRNREYLIETATLLGPLRNELVFVGGAVTGLLVTDPGAGEPRVTIDVDAIAEISSYAEYAAFGDRLRGLGFFRRYGRRCAGLPMGSTICGTRCNAARREYSRVLKPVVSGRHGGGGDPLTLPGS